LTRLRTTGSVAPTFFLASSGVIVIGHVRVAAAAVLLWGVTSPGAAQEAISAAAVSPAGAATQASVPVVVAALPPGEDPPPKETPYLEQSSLFLERSRFGFRPFSFMRKEDPEGVLVFEASPALHLFLWNPLSRYTAIRPGEDNHADVPLAGSLTFNPEMRMLARDSEPVRSPSWKIRGNLQGFYKHPQQHALKVQLSELRLSVGHYSNGQEGCPFQREQLEADGCADFDYFGEEGKPDLSLVNRATGDFSLNQLTLAGHHRWIRLRQLTPGRRHMSEHSSHTVGASLDYITGVGPGGISKELRSLYGSWGFSAEYRYERTLGAFHVLDSTARWSVEASAYAIAGVADGVYPVRLRVETAYTIPSWSDLGVFVSLLHGQDYYNLQFVDKIDYQIMLGLVVDLYPRPRHACAADKDAGCRVPANSP
jgi:hypothetical protein